MDGVGYFHGINSGVHRWSVAYIVEVPIMKQLLIKIVIGLVLVACIAGIVMMLQAMWPVM
jgi:hypothetical protein